MLEDLTEHCPPAQACREAFDRMSKATMRLCLSTKDTQYPSRLDLSTIDTHSVAQSTNSSHVMSADPSSATMDFSQRSDSWKEDEQIPKRPIPQFDMNFQNLLSGVGPPGSIPPQTESINAANTMGLGDQNVSIPFNQGQTPFVAPRNYSGIKKKTDEVLNPQLGQSYQYLNEAQPLQNLESTGFSGLAGTESGQLDFLSSFTWENGDGWDLSGTENLDLGIGMQLGLGEGRHDWSDGASFDILDGFFFGGAGNNVSGS